MPVMGIREVTVEDRWDPGDSVGDISVVSTESYTDARDGENLSIQFEYIPSAGFGEVEPVNGRIEIRRESGLVFVIIDDGTESVNQVLRELRRSSSEDISVNRRFVIDRDKIWKFLLSGDPHRVDVVTPFGGVQRVSLSEDSERAEVTLNDAMWDYPVDFARVEFSHEEREFDVRFDEELLIIDSEQDEDINYVIRAFESAISE